ncbi:MAG: hypothetical protein K2X74_14580, partial [Acetobacteraceae bacterium]|nr:hypothetical protein [Acetobacteraceae bacterium]
ASEAEAEAILAAAGGLLALLRDAQGMAGAPEIAPAFAQRGDTALVLVGNLPTTGVVLDGAVAAPGLLGLELVPIGAASHAWVT